MTDQSDRQPDNETEPATEPVAADPVPETAPPSQSRWRRLRPQGRLGQIAAILVAAAAAVVIGVSIFIAGFVVGSEGHGGPGHGHHHHHSAESEHHRDRHDSDGSKRDGGDRQDSGPGSGQGEHR